MANYATDPLKFPTKATLGARRHARKAYKERNQALAVLARMYESHIVRPTGALQSTTRSILCIHAPTGLLRWPITSEEVDEIFSSKITGPDGGVELTGWPDVNQKHPADYDDSTQAQRVERLQALAHSLTPPSKPTKTKKGAKTKEPAAPKRAPLPGATRPR